MSAERRGPATSIRFSLLPPTPAARRSELLRARVEDIDFDAKLVLLREKKRNRDRETFRTVDMTPFLESVMRKYFAEDHPGGVYAFCSKPNVMLTDGQTWKAFLTGMKGSKWHVLTRLPCLPAFLRLEPRGRWHRPACHRRANGAHDDRDAEALSAPIPGPAAGCGHNGVRRRRWFR